MRLLILGLFAVAALFQDRSVPQTGTLLDGKLLAGKKALRGSIRGRMFRAWDNSGMPVCKMAL